MTAGDSKAHRPRAQYKVVASVGLEIMILIGLGLVYVSLTGPHGSGPYD